MPPRRFSGPLPALALRAFALRARALLLGLASATLCACGVLHPASVPPSVPVLVPVPPPPVAAVPPPAPPDLSTPADRAARQLLAAGERLRALPPADLAAEITRLEAARTGSNPSPDTVLALALALAQQHNPGDLVYARELLEPLAESVTAELAPWRGLARLLAGQIAEQRRLEDQIERLAGQRRDTQRSIQQLTEKLEALKAIERSMISRSAGPGSESGALPRQP